MIDSKTSGAIGGAAQGASAGSAFGPWGAVVGGVVGGAVGLLSGGGEDDAEKLAEEQAKLIIRTSEEEQRRLNLELNQKLGLSRATIYASGLQFSGSSRKHHRFLESTFRQDMAWRKEVAARQANITRDSGDAAADAIQTAGIGSMFSGLSSAVSTFGPGMFNTPTPTGGTNKGNSGGLFGEGSTSNILSGNF